MSVEYPPCQNPNCRSFGHSHPNCRCYGGLAEGGIAENKQCSGTHQEDCEHYDGDNNLGQEIIKHAIQGHTSEDNLTDSLLNKGDPSHAAVGLLAHSGASGLLNKEDSDVSNMSGRPKGKLANATDFTLSSKANKFINELSKLSPEDRVNPDIMNDIIRPGVRKLIGRANPHIIDAVVSALSQGETSGLSSIINHASNISKGHAALTEALDSLFSGKSISHSPSTEDRDKLKQFISDGGLNKQIADQLQSQHLTRMMADGGAVGHSSQADPVTAVFPSHSMMLGMVKGNINNYLSQQQPQPPTKLPFDASGPDKSSQRKYNSALDVANKPLSVLHHAQKGTLNPEILQHLSGMYPELADHVNKKITERVTKAQLDGTKPPHKTRKGLSMLLGAELDSTMTPTSIQAAQHVFMQKKQDQQAQADTAAKKAKKGTSGLNKVAPSNMTPEQARETRQQTKG